MARYRPLIAVTMQTLQSIDGIPAGLPQSVVMNQRYYHAVSLVGAVPALVPLLDDDEDTLRELYERVDGVLVPGGVDMDPATYGEEPHPKLGNLDPARDRTELMLARWAVEDKKPFLGLCRGAQVLNVAQGGTLWQDIPSQLPHALRHRMQSLYERNCHATSIVTGSGLARLYPEHALVKTNSVHHQAVRTLGRELVIEAWSEPDRGVEAIRWTGPSYLFGVQWHPEFHPPGDASFIDDTPLLDDFLATAAARKGAAHAH